MEKEGLSVKFIKCLQLSKDCVSNGCHNFSNYINKRYMERKEKGQNEKLKMTIVKYVLVFVNLFYMVTSLVLVDIGVIGQIIHKNFYLWPGFNMLLLSMYWVATGVILLFVSLFGIIGAFRESVIWINIYGILMTVAFVLQISNAIFSFQLIGRSYSVAYEGVKYLMEEYAYSSFARSRMDWIQANLCCCGNEGPSDWMQQRPSKKSYYYYDRSTTTTTTLPTPLLPSSCCTRGSNYNDLTCDNYYRNGCTIHIREFFSETVMIVGSVALAISVLEMLGIALAFVASRFMQKTKTVIEKKQCEELGNVATNMETMKNMETDCENREKVFEIVETVDENIKTV
ncbi:Tetraspanin-6 [Pseudolycoriella hygida]|uniref:Tetraspanin-6 n=1 Tax=Pseudolycoriella hygida TaxID=35572 RepID=A0A9Q0MLN6_9DIPT|nr:Tetraspanin-6 [Pseudolycoriella hygida]